MKPRLLLQRAIVVQPLTEQQIDLYLSSTDKRLEEVREALRDDPVLRDLITTPLMLGVMTLAYHDRPGESLEVSGSANTLRRKLFEDYVLAMLKRRGIETHYTAQRTIVWLIYLAKQQMQHSQTEFYLERMQPEWLPDARSRILYRVEVGLFGWLGYGLIFWLLFGGGDAFIQHFTLRWFLWRAGLIPWKYPRFLDYAVESILLRKVGGGYIFIHRLLLEYFATPVTESPSKEAAK